MRRTFTSALAVMLTAMLLSFISMNEATAQQNPNCCTYTVNVSGIPAACFPFTINTYWTTGFPVLGPFNSNGTTNYSIPGACPPAGAFLGASINGLFPITPLNSSGNYVLSAICCLQLKIGVDGNGCVVINVQPC